MSFCTNCGRRLADGEVCTCTAPKREAAPGQTFNYTPNVNAAPVYAQPAPVAPAKKKSGKPAIFIIAAVVIIGIIAGIVIAVSGAGKGYMKPINNIVDEINKGDDANFLNLTMAGMPDFLSKLGDVAKTIDPDGYEDQQERFADKFESLLDEYSKFKISFDVSSAERLDKDDLKDYEEGYADLWDDYFEDIVEKIDDYDSDDYEDLADVFDVSVKEAKKLVSQYKDYYTTFKKIKVTDGYKVKGKYVISDGKETLNKTDSGTMYILKINGEWTIAAFKEGTSFYFDSSEDGYKYYNFLQEYLNIEFADVALQSMGG